MGKEQSPGDQPGNDRLIFMLSQLRDDLGELIDGMESKSLPYDVVVEGAKVQLSWVLKELSGGWVAVLREAQLVSGVPPWNRPLHRRERQIEPLSRGRLQSDC